MALANHQPRGITHFRFVVSIIVKPQNKLQQAFIPNRGSITAITALKSLLGNGTNREENTHLVFVTFDKPFDRVRHQKLIDVLDERGMKGKCSI